MGGTLPLRLSSFISKMWSYSSPGMSHDDRCKALRMSQRTFNMCLDVWHPMLISQQSKGGALGTGISGLGTLKANSGHSHCHASKLTFICPQTCKAKNEREALGAH